MRLVEDRPPFESLVAEHQQALLRFAQRLDADAADDLVQEALLRGLRAYDQLEEPAAFRGWMCRILHRVWLNRRQQRPAWWRAAFQRFDRTQRDTPSPEHRLSARRLGQELEGALDRLPPAQREAVWLVDGMGLTFADAAEVMGIAPGTVASRVARGRAALRGRLANTARAWGVGE